MNFRSLFFGCKKQTLPETKEDTVQLEQKATTIQLTESNPGKFWLLSNGQEITIQFDNTLAYKQAYELCPPVTAIVNKIAKPFSNAKWTIRDKNDKEVTALNDFQRLLNKPNPVQSWSQFIAQHKIFKRVYGNGFILKVIAAGFDAPAMLWNIPNQFLSYREVDVPIFKSDITSLITDIRFCYNTKIVPLDIDNILIMRDEPVNMNTMIFGDSRLRSCTYPINNILKALKARGILAARKGIPLAIISSGYKDVVGTQPLQQGEKQAIIDQMKGTYGMEDTMAQIIVSDASLNAQTIGIATKDLMLIEEIQDDTRMIADSLDFPWELLAHEKGVFDNDSQQSAWKRLYQDIAIPESIEDAKALTVFVGLDRYGYKFNTDYSHVSVLQANEKEKADAAKVLDEALQIEYNSGLITFNEWRVARGYEPIPGMDIYKTITNGTTDQYKK